MAHRVAWTLFKAPLTKGLVLDHVCRNKKCVNPSHLREVTSQINNTENTEGTGALNAAKTHCIRGHEFSGENLGWTPRGNRSPRRVCMACRRMYNKRRYTKITELIAKRGK